MIVFCDALCVLLDFVCADGRHLKSLNLLKIEYAPKLESHPRVVGAVVQLVWWLLVWVAGRVEHEVGCGNGTGR